MSTAVASSNVSFYSPHWVPRKPVQTPTLEDVEKLQAEIASLQSENESLKARIAFMESTIVAAAESLKKVPKASQNSQLRIVISEK